VMHVSSSVWRFIISWHFFLFSLFPKNLGLSPFFFHISISILILFISIFSFLLIEVLFVFNLVLQFQFDIFYLFQLGPYCFDLWFFFFGPFVNFFFNLFINYNLSYIIFFNLILLLLISNFFPWLFLLRCWWFSISSFNQSLMFFFF
jgi:hypothetical protein